MLIIPSGVKIHLALGHTDMRKGFDSLAVLVQAELKKDPFSGHLFAFRGKKADTIKILLLGLEDVETDIARAEAARKPRTRPKDVKPRRKPLPDHLPREEVRIEVNAE